MYSELPNPPKLSHSTAIARAIGAGLRFQSRISRALDASYEVARQVVHSVATIIATTTREAPPPRDWQLDFGPIEGKAGEKKTVEARPEVPFTGHKIMATDSIGAGLHSEKNGLRTRVSNIRIGQRPQSPIGTGGSLTLFFASNALGNGITWGRAEPWETIYMDVEFIEDCTWTATVFGKSAAT